MSTTNNFIYRALLVIAWVIFVGLCIEAGGLLVNFFFSMYHPALVPNLYQKLDLTKMYSENKWDFFKIYSFILVIAILKAHLFYIVVRLMHKLDLSNPFNAFVAKQILQISYYTFSIGLLSYIARETVKRIQVNGYVTADLNTFWADSQAFILMSAIIYIIAIIFKKGLAMQSEIDLTV